VGCAEGKRFSSQRLPLPRQSASGSSEFHERRSARALFNHRSLITELTGSASGERTGAREGSRTTDEHAAFGKELQRARATISLLRRNGLVIGDVGGRAARMRIAGARPEVVREGATVTVGWGPGDAPRIARA